MLIYEKDNKLNISFENNMDETDIVVGKDEVKIGDSTISENNVLPVATEEDVGKVPTVQDDGSYALANAGGGSEPFIVTITGTINIGEQPTITYTIDKTLEEIISAINNRLNVLCYVVTEYNILVLTDIEKKSNSVIFSHLGAINYKVGGGYSLSVEKFTITDEGVTHTGIAVDAHD